MADHHVWILMPAGVSLSMMGFRRQAYWVDVPAPTMPRTVVLFSDFLMPYVKVLNFYQ